MSVHKRVKADGISVNDAIVHGSLAAQRGIYVGNMQLVRAGDVLKIFHLKSDHVPKAIAARDTSITSDFSHTIVGWYDYAFAKGWFQNIDEVFPVANRSDDFEEELPNAVLEASVAALTTQVNNLDSILSVPDLSGVYIGPADMSISYGLKPKFDVKEDPVFSNIKLIAKKAKEHNKIAGIHNGTVEYAKEMIELGYKFISVSSDYRSMTAHAQSVVNTMKNLNQKKEEKTY